MSFILEALRKAERERADSAVPSIASEHPLPAPPDRPRWPWILGAALVLNVVLAAGLVAILRQPGPPATPPAAPVASRSVAADGEAPAAAGPTTAPAPETAGPSLPVASATPVPPAAPPRIALPAPARSPVRPAPPPQAGAVPPESRERVVAPRVIEPPSPAPAPAAAPAAPAGPAAPPVEARAGGPPVVPPPRPAPLREPVATAPRPAVGPAAAPRYHLDVHVYSETPSGRMVFINGQKYVEGQRLDEHTVLETITAEGAVLSQQGQRLMLRP